jgi:hypothetical protein
MPAAWRSIRTTSTSWSAPRTRNAKPPEQASSERKRPLFKKSGAKTFFHLGRACFSAAGPKEQKFFAPLFFKKAATLRQIKESGLGKLVWLASYPKSGNTWLRAFLHNFLRQPEAPHSINALTDLSVVECASVFFGASGAVLTPAEVQKLRPGVHERLMALHPRPVFVKTHNANLALHDVPLCTPAATAGAIYIVRDPRDVAVSYAAFTGKSIDEIIAFMADPGAANRGTDAQVFELLSSWSAHALSWVGAQHRLLLRYEDLLAKPEAAFGRVARFLGAGADEARLRRAITFSDFLVLAEQERNEGYRASGTAAPGAFFRAGKSGQWREALTAAQADAIIAAHGEVMRNFGYLS